MKLPLGTSRLIVLAVIGFLFTSIFPAAAFNVKDFGAEGDGVTDDTTAFAAAYAAAVDAGGGTVFVPAGTYVINNLELAGAGGNGIGVNLQGASKDSTTLICNLTTSYLLRLGATSGPPFKGKISNLRITRAAGTPGVATMGISAAHFAYLVIEDVIIDRHGVGLKTSEGWSSFDLGLTLSRIQIHSSIIHLWLKDVAETFINDSNFGVNGGETVDPIVLVQFEGITNDVRIHKSQFIPRAATVAAAAFKWINTPADNGGMYRFYDINIENALTGFQSDSTTFRINDLHVTGSRLTQNGKLFDFHANTQLLNISILNNSAMKSDIPSTLTGALMSRFCGNNMNGGLTFAGGDWIVSGNTFTTDSNYTGTFRSLVLTNNALIFNGTVAIKLNVTGTGKIMQSGNVADFADFSNPQPFTHIAGIPPKVSGVNLKAVGNYPVFVVPTGKNFIFKEAFAVITAVSGYNSAVLPQIIVDAGHGNPFLGVSSADSFFSTTGNSLPIRPLTGGGYSIAKAGQTVRVLSNAANPSTTLTATVYIFGEFVDAEVF